MVLSFRNSFSSEVFARKKSPVRVQPQPRWARSSGQMYSTDVVHSTAPPVATNHDPQSHLVTRWGHQGSTAGPGDLRAPSCQLRSGLIRSCLHSPPSSTRLPAGPELVSVLTQPHKQRHTATVALLARESGHRNSTWYLRQLWAHLPRVHHEQWQLGEANTDPKLLQSGSVTAAWHSQAQDSGYAWHVFWYMQLNSAKNTESVPMPTAPHVGRDPALGWTPREITYWTVHQRDFLLIINFMIISQCGTHLFEEDCMHTLKNYH